MNIAGIIPVLKKLGIIREITPDLEQQLAGAIFWFVISFAVIGIIFLVSFYKELRLSQKEKVQWLIKKWFFNCWGANAIRGQALVLIIGIVVVCFFAILGFKSDPIMALGLFLAVMMPAYLRPAWTFDILSEKWHLWNLTFFPSMAMGLLIGAAILEPVFDPTALLFLVVMVAVNWAFWGHGGMSRESVANLLTAGGGTGKLVWVDAILNVTLATQRHALWKSIILMMSKGQYKKVLSSFEWQELKTILKKEESDFSIPIKDVRILDSIANPELIDGLVEKCLIVGVTAIELAELQLKFWYLYLVPEDDCVRDKAIDKATQDIIVAIIKEGKL